MQQRAVMGILSTLILAGCGPGGIPPVENRRKTGCSGEVCAAEEVVSSCTWRPEYACYQQAVCSPRPGGACGFVVTPALDRCLAQARGCVHQGVHHAVGEGFPAGDGCNSCSCTEPCKVVCTLIYCPAADGGAPNAG
jgi:hypothetical protein